MVIVTTFWILIGLLLYSYIGYTIILYIIKALKSIFIRKHKEESFNGFHPNITLVVAAYNEEKNIEDKIQNTLQQDYPKGKIAQIWVNDGSSDKTSELLHKYSDITVLDQERQGKVGAINHAMQYVKTPYTVFSDANAMLSSQAIRKLMAPFTNPKVGCVAGEKRIFIDEVESAATSGEGTYWRYESLIKKLESSCGSTLSATGELYAIRTELYQNVRKDSILDDFEISIQAIKKGYRVKYVPDSYAIEKGSASIHEEKKRKIRIAAGSFQSLFRNLQLLNPLKHPFFAFQFFSHKVLRWFILPISLFAIPALNILILYFHNQSILYLLTLVLQIAFILFVIAGWILKNKQISNKILFLPYYLFMMNISIIQGFIRYISGKQNVKWEKSARQT